MGQVTADSTRPDAFTGITAVRSTCPNLQALSRHETNLKHCICHCQSYSEYCIPLSIFKCPSIFMSLDRVELSRGERGKKEVCKWMITGVRSFSAVCLGR